MLDQFNTAIKDYKTKWDKFVAERADQDFFAEAKPTALGWKVADKTEFNACVAGLQDACTDVVHIFMNDRWIAKCVLREPLQWNVPIVKIMQVRPDSTDALGLDHLDFYSSGMNQAQDVLKKEPNLKWTVEQNGEPHYPSWLSVWFAGTEAKLRPDTVLGVTMLRLAELNDSIKKERE